MQFIYQSHANQPGIYKIFNTHTNRIYVGQAARFERRWYDHKRQLLNGRHQNKFLLNDFNKCRAELGHDDFLEFHVLEVMEGSTKEGRNKREEEWIAQHWDKQDLCYNFKQKTTGKERTCYSLTPEETRQKISEGTKRGLANPETREKLRLARIGKPSPAKGMKFGPCSNEKKLKISQANKGQIPVIKGKKLAELVGVEKAQELSVQSKLRATKIYDGFILQSPNGTIHTRIEGIGQFCLEHDLDRNILSRLLRRECHQHKGWRLISNIPNNDFGMVMGTNLSEIPTVNTH